MIFTKTVKMDEKRYEGSYTYVAKRLVETWWFYSSLFTGDILL